MLYGQGRRSGQGHDQSRILLIRRDVCGTAVTPCSDELIRAADTEQVPKRHPAINMAVRNKTTFFGQSACFRSEKHVQRSDRIKLCLISNPSSLRKSRLATQAKSGCRLILLNSAIAMPSTKPCSVWCRPVICAVSTVVYMTNRRLTN